MLKNKKYSLNVRYDKRRIYANPNKSFNSNKPSSSLFFWKGGEDFDDHKDIGKTQHISRKCTHEIGRNETCKDLNLNLKSRLNGYEQDSF